MTDLSESVSRLEAQLGGALCALAAMKIVSTGWPKQIANDLAAAEADARAMREAIGHVVGILGYQGMWCLVCHHVEGEHGRWDAGGGKTFGICPVPALGAAALRGWYPGFYVQK